MPRRSTVLTAAALALLLAPAAFAHVEVSPDRVAAGSTTRLTLSVPSERAHAATIGLTVKLPAGLRVLSFAPKFGWTLGRSGSIVTWSGGRIAPGRTDRFTFRARLPLRARTVLRFPTLQTYSDGRIVYWIGPASSDTPAPVVRVAPGNRR
jgi:uncharacterized protein YcnI